MEIESGIDDFKFKTIPRKHQLETWLASKNREYYAIFHEPRTGKTKIALDTASYLFHRGFICHLIYIAPAGVIGEILNVQVPIHMDTDNVTVFRAKLPLKKVPEFNTEKLIIIGINIEALSHKKGVDFIETMLTRYRSLMVVDESTFISSPKALRTKAVIRLGRLAKYRRIMTGTPIADSVLDIASQVNFLGPMEVLLETKNWYTFRARYCDLMPVSYGARQFIRVVGPRRIDELINKLSLYSSFKKLEDVVEDLPSRTYQKYLVEMDAITKRHYSEMVRTFSTLIEKKACTASIAITKLVRLMQIVSGFAVVTDEVTEDNEKIVLSDIRYIELLKLIETLPGKIVIWSVFSYCVDKICNYLREKYGESSVARYDGAISLRDKQYQLELFRDSNECRFFVSNPRVGGYGLNLSVANTAIYFNNYWSVEERIQSENRLVCGGSKNLYIDMYMPGIDEKILDSLKNKKNLVDMILSNNVELENI